MKREFLLLAVAAVVPALACAKKPVKTEESAPAPAVAVEEEPVITEECLGQVSLFSEYCKTKAYADAYEPWLDVYKNCPNANKAIYSKGSQILEWKYKNAANDQERTEIANLAMQMYDKRMKYFGDDTKYPVAYIMGQKGVDFFMYFPNQTTNREAYGWLKQSVNEMGNNSQLSVLVKLAEVSTAIYKANPETFADQYISDYQQVSSALQAIWDNPASKNATAAAQQKEYVDGLFAASGAASCEKMDELYKNYVSTNGQYLEDLLKLMKLFKSVGCTESEVYFAAAEAAHKLQPTAESAAGCAKMCIKKEDWTGALEYYSAALSLLEEGADSDKGDYYLSMATILMDKLHRYADARTMARRAMESDPSKSGRCYLLIGLCYAAAQPYQAPEYPAAKAAILNKTVFWAAVDQFQKAKQYPDCADDATKLIAAYSKYFPSKVDLFDLQAVFGDGYFIVGGWINEKTTCRPAR